MSKTDIQNRIGLIFVNECVHCLEEGILFHAKDGDLAAILGLGFPPFTGGPFSFIDNMGADKVNETLTQLSDKHGNRFNPAKLLAKHAKENKSFID